MTVGVSMLVEAWGDQSGNGNHLLQTAGAEKPLLSAYGLAGRPALSFDGNDSLSHPNAMPQGSYTVIALLSLSDLNATNDLLTSDAGWSVSFMGSPIVQVRHEQSLVTSWIGVEQDTPILLSITYDAAASALNIFQDGIATGNGILPTQLGSSIQLGGNATEGNLVGKIAEVLIYDRVLPADERMQVEALLADSFDTADADLVTLGPLPNDGQILQQVADGFADVGVTGQILSEAVQGVGIDLFGDGRLIQSVFEPTVIVPQDLSLSVSLTAGLVDYDMEVYVQTQADRIPIARRDNLACGELVLVNGQSNAVAGDFHSEGLADPLESIWIRTYGTSTQFAGFEATDRHWDVADGEGVKTHAAVGQIALQLGSDLLHQLVVPVGLLNGAVSGTSIEDHQRSDSFPTDQETIYGRLLLRAQSSGFADRARSMIWYQGERDSSIAEPYLGMFQHLHDDWMEDFSSLERIFAFQVRAGCNHDLINDGIREVIRLLPETFPTVQLMSTTNADGHDGCHFFHQGYIQLGTRVAQQVLRDQYSFPHEPDFDPPNLDFVEWVDSAQDSLLLTFRDPEGSLVFEAGSEVDFLLDDGTAVISGSVSRNTLLLTLAGPSTAQSISYVGHPLDGPFLHNLRGVGALTFFDQPILP